MNSSYTRALGLALLAALVLVCRHAGGQAAPITAEGQDTVGSVSRGAALPVAAPPQKSVDTTFSLPKGKRWAVHDAAGLKRALDESQPGDVVVLDAVTYVGPFTLSAKTNPQNKWIYIVPSTMPPPGRINPSSAPMPKIVTPNADQAIKIAAGANHYRLVGLEVTTQAPKLTYTLIGPTDNKPSPLPDFITIDRCFVHGVQNIDTRRGIAGNGTNFAVIDSDVSDIHMQGTDSQAFAAWYTPGPIKLTNNKLEASSENVMFGGAGGVDNPYVPSDIEIRGNWLYKPMQWAQVGVSIPPRNTMVVKNNLEFKSARRVLVEDNLLENNWVSGQTGWALSFGPRTGQSGNIAVVNDITIRNNVLKNVSSGFDILAADNECSNYPGCVNRGESKRINIENNLILLGDTTQPGYEKGYVYGGIIMNQVTDLVLQHNTVVPPPNLGYCKGSFFFNSKPPFTDTQSGTQNVWILDNLLCRQINGTQGLVGRKPSTLSDYMGQPKPVGPRFSGNVFYVGQQDEAYTVPPNNYVAGSKESTSDRKEYRLKYPAKLRTTTGNPPGADVSKLSAAYAAASPEVHSGSRDSMSKDKQ